MSQGKEPGAVGREIGQLNGWWSMLLKLFLLAFPVVLVWMGLFTAWVVRETYATQAFRESPERVSRNDLYRFERDTRDWVEANFTQKTFEEDLRELKSLMRELQQRLQRIEAKIE